MSTNLVIVESPAKAKTIEKYLGKDFKVLASYGHVRDLVPKEGAIDTDRDFEMKYQLIEKNEKHVNAIKQALKKADTLYLATDQDREGEAISWHLYELLKEAGALKDVHVHRVVFNEVTKRAIKHAIDSPRDLSLDLINAQQARRALDYLVGFNLSPLLWKKVQRGLSAGRVQSPALRLIVEREEEIEAFVPQEYWTIEADADKDTQAFLARLLQYKNEKVQQFSFTNEADATGVRQTLLSAANGVLTVAAIEKKERKRNPAAPFTTSTLQQEAARKLRFSAQRTMRTAQQLYEGIDIGGETVGLITYMRTDSVSLANEAIAEIRGLIEQNYGKDYLPEAPRVFKNKSKNAQEAHEAIRPTSVRHIPDQIKSHLKPDQFALYELVWKRAMACQMIHATLDTVAVDLACGEGNLFRANGSTIRHPGFMKVYTEDFDDDRRNEDREKILPEMTQGEKIKLIRGQPGKNTGRIRHRPPVDLRQHHLDPGQPPVRRTGEPPLHAHRYRSNREQLPDRTLHTLRRLRVHRESGRRTRQRVARRGRLGTADAAFLGAVPQAGRRQGCKRQSRGCRAVAPYWHRPGKWQADQRAHGAVRPVRADRRQGRRGQAAFRQPQARHENARRHPGQLSGPVRTAA
jgi:DNA topoisomerase-1